MTTKRSAYMEASEREIDRLQQQIERLQRENGSLARMYALAQDLLRERTGRLNQAEAEIERLRAMLEICPACGEVSAKSLRCRNCTLSDA